MHSWFRRKWQSQWTWQTGWTWRLLIDDQWVTCNDVWRACHVGHATWPWMHWKHSILCISWVCFCNKNWKTIASFALNTKSHWSQFQHCDHHSHFHWLWLWSPTIPHFHFMSKICVSDKLLAFCVFSCRFEMQKSKITKFCVCAWMHIVSNNNNSNDHDDDDDKRKQQPHQQKQQQQWVAAAEKAAEKATMTVIQHESWLVNLSFTLSQWHDDDKKHHQQLTTNNNNDRIYRSMKTMTTTETTEVSLTTVRTTKNSKNGNNSKNRKIKPTEAAVATTTTAKTAVTEMTMTTEKSNQQQQQQWWQWQQHQQQCRQQLLQQPIENPTTPKINDKSWQRNQEDLQWKQPQQQTTKRMTGATTKQPPWQQFWKQQWQQNSNHCDCFCNDNDKTTTTLTVTVTVKHQQQWQQQQNRSRNKKKCNNNKSCGSSCKKNINTNNSLSFSISMWNEHVKFHSGSSISSSNNNNLTDWKTWSWEKAHKLLHWHRTAMLLNVQAQNWQKCKSSCFFCFQIQSFAMFFQWQQLQGQQWKEQWQWQKEQKQNNNNSAAAVEVWKQKMATTATVAKQQQKHQLLDNHLEIWTFPNCQCVPFVLFCDTETLSEWKGCSSRVFQTESLNWTNDSQLQTVRWCRWITIKHSMHCWIWEFRSPECVLPLGQSHHLWIKADQRQQSNLTSCSGALLQHQQWHHLQQLPLHLKIIFWWLQEMLELHGKLLTMTGQVVMDINNEALKQFIESKVKTDHHDIFLSVWFCVLMKNCLELTNSHEFIFLDSVKLKRSMNFCASTWQLCLAHSFNNCSNWGAKHQPKTSQCACASGAFSHKNGHDLSPDSLVTLLATQNCALGQFGHLAIKAVGHLWLRMTHLSVLSQEHSQTSPRKGQFFPKKSVVCISKLFQKFCPLICPTCLMVWQIDDAVMLNMTAGNGMPVTADELEWTALSMHCCIGQDCLKNKTKNGAFKVNEDMAVAPDQSKSHTTMKFSVTMHVHKCRWGKARADSEWTEGPRPSWKVKKTTDSNNDHDFDVQVMPMDHNFVPQDDISTEKETSHWGELKLSLKQMAEWQKRDLRFNRMTTHCQWRISQQKRCLQPLVHMHQGECASQTKRTIAPAIVQKHKFEDLSNSGMLRATCLVHTTKWGEWTKVHVTDEVTECIAECPTPHPLSVLQNAPPHQKSIATKMKEEAKCLPGCFNIAGLDWSLMTMKKKMTAQKNVMEMLQHQSPKRSRNRSRMWKWHRHCHEQRQKLKWNSGGRQSWNKQQNGTAVENQEDFLDTLNSWKTGINPQQMPMPTRMKLTTMTTITITMCIPEEEHSPLTITWQEDKTRRGDLSADLFHACSKGVSQCKYTHGTAQHMIKNIFKTKLSLQSLLYLLPSVHQIPEWKNGYRNPDAW